MHFEEKSASCPACERQASNQTFLIFLFFFRVFSWCISAPKALSCDRLSSNGSDSRGIVVIICYLQPLITHPHKVLGVSK